MRKRIIALLLSVCIMTPVFAEDKNERISEIENRIEELNKELEDLNAELKELKKTDGFSFEEEGSKFDYLRNEVVERDGEEYAVLYFEYTNTSDGVSSASQKIGMQAFQDGVELSECALYGYGIEALENTWKSVQAGTTLEIARAYKITSRNDLSLYIGYIGAWNPEEFTITLE